MKIISFYPENRDKVILEKGLGSITEYSFSPLERENVPTINYIPYLFIIFKWKGIGKSGSFKDRNSKII